MNVQYTVQLLIKFSTLESISHPGGRGDRSRWHWGHEQEEDKKWEKVKKIKDGRGKRKENWKIKKCT
jgi:hypothetical protein